MRRCVIIGSGVIAVLFLLSAVGGMADAGSGRGPRVNSVAFVPDNPVAGQATIQLTLDKPLHAGSVTTDVVTVTTLDLSDGNSQWLSIPIAATYNSIANTISVALNPAPLAGILVRVILRGTGPEPVMGTNGLPLDAKSHKPVGADYINAFIAP